MGKRGRDSDAATWSTHVAYFEHVAPAHECLIVENVPEYSEMLVLKCLKKSGYSWQAKSLRIDPRVLGLGCARARLYMVIFRTDIFRWEPNFTLEQLVDCLAGQVALSAGSYYWAKLPPVKLSTAQETWLNNCECEISLPSCLPFCCLFHIHFQSGKEPTRLPAHDQAPVHGSIPISEEWSWEGRNKRWCSSHIDNYHWIIVVRGEVKG